MTNYVDKIMSNHVFNSESSEDLSYLYSDGSSTNQKGGDGSSNDSLPKPSSKPRSKASGGFPPIVIINAKEKEVEQTKNRQLAPGKATVSIRDILKSKK